MRLPWVAATPACDCPRPVSRHVAWVLRFRHILAMCDAQALQDVAQSSQADPRDAPLGQGRGYLHMRGTPVRRGRGQHCTSIGVILELPKGSTATASISAHRHLWQRTPEGPGCPGSLGRPASCRLKHLVPVQRSCFLCPPCASFSWSPSSEELPGAPCFQSPLGYALAK